MVEVGDENAVPSLGVRAGGNDVKQNINKLPEFHILAVLLETAVSTAVECTAMHFVILKVREE